MKIPLSRKSASAISFADYVRDRIGIAPLHGTGLLHRSTSTTDHASPEAWPELLEAKIDHQSNYAVGTAT